MSEHMLCVFENCFMMWTFSCTDGPFQWRFRCALPNLSLFLITSRNNDHYCHYHHHHQHRLFGEHHVPSGHQSRRRHR